MTMLLAGHLPRVEPFDVTGEGDSLGRYLGRERRRRATPKDPRVLRWHDHWRHRDRVLRWQGPCVGCGYQTWSFDDGENDPRGVLGDAALWTVTTVLEDEETEVEIRCCSICANDYTRYQLVLRNAHDVEGVRMAVPYNFGAGHPYQDLPEEKR